uniref:Deoxyuridine 5'-triphosphate nucleotidohydrolase n=1 Tax=Meloidogyne floridensis TaxID=298350 RepID=A0A915NT77_9BILA
MEGEDDATDPQIFPPEEEEENEEHQLSYKKIKKEALAPVFGSEGAVGADLHSAEECVVPAKGKYLVSTGLQIALPKGYYGRIAPRPGFASKNFVDVSADISVGDRIAQLVCTSPKLVEVTNLDENDDEDEMLVLIA